MKSPSYYSRKAAALRECGHWTAADEMAKMAAKARNACKREKERASRREAAIKIALLEKAKGGAS